MIDIFYRNYLEQQVKPKLDALSIEQLETMDKAVQPLIDEYGKEAVINAFYQLVLAED